MTKAFEAAASCVVFWNELVDEVNNITSDASIIPETKNKENNFLWMILLSEYIGNTSDHIVVN